MSLPSDVPAAPHALADRDHTRAAILCELVDVVCASLFDAKQWPSKLLFTPMLARSHIGTAMPSSLGRVPNPFHYCAVKAEG